MPKEDIAKDQLIEIRWHGRGGQGVVTAGKLLAEIALDAGQYFQAFPDYGPERMGAPIRAFTRLSDNPIHIHSQIAHPDIVIVLDPTVMEAVDVSEGMNEGGVFIINSSKSPEEMRKLLRQKNAKVFTVDASGIAIEHLGREITNTPMLGAFSAAVGLYKPELIAKQIRKQFERKFGEKTVEANIAAMNQAYEEVQGE